MGNTWQRGRNLNASFTQTTGIDQAYTGSGERTACRERRIQQPDPGRPIKGREVVAAIFAQSSSTRGSGTYTAEFKLDERTTFLRWVGTMDGHKFESLEIIVDNEQGLIVERTVSLRPYPALKLFRDAMYAALKDKLPPDVWDYPTPS